MKNYQKMSVAQDARVELHDSLAPKGCRKFLHSVHLLCRA